MPRCRIINNCRECGDWHYSIPERSAFCTVEQRQITVANRDIMMPDWCPLTVFPVGASTSPQEEIISSIR